MKLFKQSIIALLALAIFTTSCKKEETPAPPADPLSEFVLITTLDAPNTNYTAKVYAREAFYVGYNQVIVKLTDKTTGNNITDATVIFKPLMDMNSGMKHACPTEKPMYNDVLKAMDGTITYVMPGGQMGQWNLGLEIMSASGDSDMLSTTIDVMAKDDAQLFSFISAADSNQSVFVALVNPKQPQIGSNDFEVVVYQRKSMMDWPAIEKLNIEIEPWMPTMNHGSENNVNPTDMQNGHYLGKVDFSMTGYWQVKMVIKDDKGNIMKDDAYFDIRF
ncbi:MAG: FixH family protein [Schleiferiaceae bacterium]|nr:FixH family protein [Schleiferiaceae bacterium]